MDVFLPGTPLTSKEKTFLSKYLNPVYLTNQTLVVLASRFAEESSLELHAFLVENLASELETFLRLQDQDDGYTQGARGERTPQHDSGISGGSGWKLTGPPHKRRYCLLQSTETSHPTPDSTPSSMSILQELQDVLFPSAAFRSWLAALSSLLPLGYAVEARRFRPGLDYTLARSEGEARLDVCLGLTPKSFEGPGWEGGSWGGWEVRSYSRKSCRLINKASLINSVIWRLTKVTTTQLSIDLAIRNRITKRKMVPYSYHNLVLTIFYWF